MRKKALGGSLLLLVLGSLTLLSHGNEEEIRYIGIPDGSPGLIFRYLSEGTGIKAINFSPYTLYDCCGSAGQYAMGSGRLDMAVMCVEAASALVKKNKQYTITGPVIMNSDILVTRQGTASKEMKIAVSQKRSFQHRMVQDLLGPRSLPVPMLHSAVPYAYGRGVVQGAVVDIAKALDLPGVLHQAAVNKDQHRVTHVMVIKKSLGNTMEYQQFMDNYAKAVDHMQDKENLLGLLRTYLSKEITTGDVDTWEKMKVRFIHPLNSRRQG